MISQNEILAFWFDEVEPRMWWVAEPSFDELIRQRFLSAIQQAAAGELHLWRSTPQGRLAEIIVLDQFSRNAYRGTPKAFSQDPIALVLSQEAVATGALIALNQAKRAFLLLPYMHSESPRIHTEAEVLYKEFAAQGNYDFELRHKAIVDRFGRYPHRNQVLGRESTLEEVEFLSQPGSSF